MIQGDHGPIAVRNVEYKLFGNPTPQIKDLRFAYYKGKFQTVDEFKGKIPNETGQLNKITWDLGHGIIDFAYEYSGNMEIPVSGEYTFSLATFGNSSLTVNGQNILDDQNESPRSQTIRLEKGATPFKLIFLQTQLPGKKTSARFLC
ncbi:PA14 domain-containing protein [Algoriphagus boritolerans]|uniref:PA14 domain-containing protein n=1 Tax=Algoriphagus boritolerans TaxID=308111 RepID=UPI000A6E07C5